MTDNPQPYTMLLRNRRQISHQSLTNYRSDAQIGKSSRSLAPSDKFYLGEPRLYNRLEEVPVCRGIAQVSSGLCVSVRSSCPP